MDHVHGGVDLATRQVVEIDKKNVYCRQKCRAFVQTHSSSSYAEVRDLKVGICSNLCYSRKPVNHTSFLRADIKDGVLTFQSGYF